MRSASLPPRPGQGRAGRGDQPRVSVAGDELDPGEAAGDEVAEEGQPAGAVLGGADLQAGDLPVTLRVHAGRHQHGDLDHPAALTDLHRQGVRGDERVRAGIQRAGAERGDLLVEVARHLRHLRLRQPGDPQGLHEVLHPPRRDPEQVAGRDDRGQRGLRPAAALQQPVREVGTLLTALSEGPCEER